MGALLLTTGDGFEVVEGPYLSTPFSSMTTLGAVVAEAAAGATGLTAFSVVCFPLAHG